MAKAPFRTIAAIFLISLIARLLIGRDIAYPYELIRWFPFCRLFEFSLGVFVAAVACPSSWSTANNLPRVIQKTLSFCGEISFPLFLMHVPFLFMIPRLCARGYSPVLAIGVFLLVSVGLSWMVLLIDRRIPRQTIFERLLRAARPGAVR
jgi:peptidoglycan/LPS O-acetylase OafA/YrhL